LSLVVSHNQWRLLRGRQKQNEYWKKITSLLACAGAMALAIVLAGQTSGTLSFIDSNSLEFSPGPPQKEMS